MRPPVLRNGVLNTFLLLLPAWASVPANADYTPDISDGKIPADITVANESETLPESEYYRHGWTAEGWTVEGFGSRGYVFMAPSHTGKEQAGAMRSILTLPEYEITADTWLRWDACSMLDILPEDYAVEILAEGSGNPVTVCTVSGEASEWTTHMLPLAEFAGLKCRVSFVCTSANRYELMIGGIALTEPAAPVWSGKNSIPAYGDMSGTEISGTITNYGAAAVVEAVLLLDESGNETDRIDMGLSVATTESFGFSFTGKAERDKRTAYSVSLLLADGEIAPVSELKGSYFSSLYTRKHLVDKGTGMWCPNCPEGDIQMETLQRSLGSSVIPVVTHQNDALANSVYFSALKYYSIPAFRMDRNREGNNKFSNMDSFYDVAANHEVVFEKVDLSDPDMLNLRVVVRHPDTETSDFRLGYVVTADFRSDRYYQRNNTYGVSGERFYFLPSKVPGELLEFRNVSLTSEHAFEGMEASSVSVQDGICCSVYEFSVPRPEILDNFRSATAVAFAIDNTTSLVLNAASAKLDKDSDFTGADKIVGGYTASESPAEYYSLQGIRVSNPTRGIFIRRQGNKSSKIILK